MSNAFVFDPKRHYGTADDPRLALNEAGDYVGCNKSTIVNRLGDKLVWDKSHCGTTGFRNTGIRTWKLADLDELKAERARVVGSGVILDVDGEERFTPKKVAAEMGWSIRKARAAIARANEPKDTYRGMTLPGGKPLRQNVGKPVQTVSREVFEDFKKDIEARPLKNGHVTMHALLQEITREAKGKGEPIKVRNLVQEFQECVSLWAEMDKLNTDTAINNSVRTQEAATCNRRQFFELWDHTCSVKQGVAQLKILLPIGQQKTVVELDSAMQKKGFTGMRLQKVKRQAGTASRLLEGDKPGSAWVCERIDPKKPRDAAPDPTAQLKSILGKGAVLSSELKHLAALLGVETWDLYDLFRKADASKARLGFSGPYCWFIGTKPASVEDCQRLKRQDAPPATNGHADAPQAQPSIAAAPKGTPGRRGSAAVLEVYKFCHERYTSTSAKLASIRSAAAKLFGARAPKEDSHVTEYADRYARREKLPKPERPKEKP